MRDDAMIEVCHADTQGGQLFGRCGTGTAHDCSFRFETIKPGGARPDANARDEVLAEVPGERRSTLIARREVLPGGVVYHFDIRMQGPDETVFSICEAVARAFRSYEQE